MCPFKIQPHNRLQEWVADTKGYFRDEGLDEVFHVPYSVDDVGIGRTYQMGGSVQSTEVAPDEIKRGAFETVENGRACDISSACHWAVNAAASSRHGRVWGHAYSIAPAGIYVAPESDIRRPSDLADRPIGVGYHSGTHFATLQAQESIVVSIR